MRASIRILAGVLLSLRTVVAAGQPPIVPSPDQLEEITQHRQLGSNNVGPVPDPQIIRALAAISAPRRNVETRSLLDPESPPSLYSSVAIVGDLTDPQARQLIARCGRFKNEIFRIIASGKYVTVSSGAIWGSKVGSWSDLTFERTPKGWRLLFQQDWIP